MPDDAQDAQDAMPDGDLERTLADHWQRVQQRGTYSITLAAPLDAVVEKGHFRVPDVPATSKVPGGGAIHSVVGKTVTRHLTDLCEQLDEFARAVHGALVAIVEALDDPVPPEVQGRIDDVADQLTVLQRQLNAMRATDE